MSGVGGVVVGDRFDITVEAVSRVAWRGEPVSLAEAAVRRMDECAAAFDALVRAKVRADPEALIYGVTSAPGDAARVALDAEARARRPTRLWTAMSYGEPLPERVTRAILLARLANFVGGHAAVRSRVAVAVVGMLNGGPLPVVPAQSNGGSGEVLPLGTLFYDLSGRLDLTAKERMALINGSPCAAALIADAALAGRAWLVLAEQVFALVAEITGAPREHYGRDLDELWGDEHEAAALRSLRDLLGSACSACWQGHQAAVSLRILPRVLGAARRAQANAERAAEVSLSSVTDNPVFLAPDERHPAGAVHSTGGYHNAQAAPAIDALSFAHADLCQLSQRLSDHLFQHPETAPHVGDEWSVKPLHMAINGWAEEARSIVAPTLLSLGAFGQNDVPELAFLAWRKAAAAARCLDGALAGLAVLASQVLNKQERDAPEALHDLVYNVRAIVPPVEQPRALGAECQHLYERLTQGATGQEVPFT